MKQEIKLPTNKNYNHLGDIDDESRTSSQNENQRSKSEESKIVWAPIEFFTRDWNISISDLGMPWVCKKITFEIVG